MTILFACLLLSACGVKGELKNDAGQESNPEKQNLEWHAKPQPRP